MSTGRLALPRLQVAHLKYIIWFINSLHNKTRIK
jgi:hypothetical protein